jgi:hypothetical protein
VEQILCADGGARQQCTAFGLVSRGQLKARRKVNAFEMYDADRTFVIKWVRGYLCQSSAMSRARATGCTIASVA